MPAQKGEQVVFTFEFSVLGVPTSGLSPAPLITIFSPAGAVLVNAAAMTEQVSAQQYTYSYTLPSVSGFYKARTYSSQANLDLQYLTTGVQVGQVWIENLDEAISTTATPAQVNAEILDVLTVDTFIEPTVVPVWPMTLKTAWMWMIMIMRNSLKQTINKQTVYANDDTTPIAHADWTDDGTQTVRGKFEDGA